LLLPLFAEDLAGVVLVPLPFLAAGLVPRGVNKARLPTVPNGWRNP
jgi:hypothetical protein